MKQKHRQQWESDLEARYAKKPLSRESTHFQHFARTREIVDVDGANGQRHVAHVTESGLLVSGELGVDLQENKCET